MNKKVGTKNIQKLKLSFSSLFFTKFSKMSNSSKEYYRPSPES